MLQGGWMYILPFDHGGVQRRLRAARGIARLLRADRARPGQGDAEACWRSTPRSRPSSRTPGRWSVQLRAQDPAPPGARQRAAVSPAAACLRLLRPLFSPGIAWTLLAVERLATLLDGRYGDYREYGNLLQQEADQIETLIEAARLAMDDFSLFKG